MTTLAIRGSRFHNAVSRIHAAVTAKMLQELWPQIPAEENPIDYVTNAVHVPTFLAPEWAAAFDRYLGDDWDQRLHEPQCIECLRQMPDEEFWKTHQALKSQMLQLVRDVKKSVNSDLSVEWLKPFMTERQCAAGEIMFYKDEKAEDMLYIVSGKFKLVESGIVLPVGAIVGELGMLSPSNMRTQTLECVEAGLVLSVSYSKVEELYVQNPAFGFYFLRLSSARLFQNLETLQQQLNQQTASAAAPKPA